MEHKTWLWKKKSSEKIANASEKSDFLKEKALALERSLEELNEQLLSVRNDSSTKDDLLSKQAKVAEEAIKGWEKVEAEALFFKQQLDDALLQKEAAEERLVDTEAALRECMRQLQVVKEDQQQIINNAAIKISREQEKARMLEDRLLEANKGLSESLNDINNLSRILEAKEQLICELSESKSKSQANCKEVMSKLDYAEKNNASLKYEVCMLQKELEIRSQEREFNLKSADAAHRQQLESIKKISKLETECQRLRVMIRKRLPGPAAIAKMRSEVEMLGNDTNGHRKKKSNSTSEALKTRDFASEEYGAPSKTIASVVGRLHLFEEENRVLKESLIKKSDELQSSRAMFARTASKLSQVENHLEELSKGDASPELAKSNPVSYELSLPSISQHGGDDDNASCAESWASALISELEHFRNGKSTAASCKDTGMSELRLMDDFIEMEKLAIVAVDKNAESARDTSADYKAFEDAKEVSLGPDLPEITGKELVSIKNFTELNEANQESVSLESSPSWFQDIVSLIIEKHHVTQKSIDTILAEVGVALSGKECSIEAKNLGSPCFNVTQLQQARHTSSDSFDGAVHRGTLNSSSAQPFPANLEKQVLKLIELMEGIIQRTIKSKNSQDLVSEDGGSTPLLNKSVSLNLYVTRTFLWECSELTNVLQKFVTICNDLLYRTVDLERFIFEITLALDWIINHCFSLQDVSDMKETIQKHLSADYLQIDRNPATEMEKVDVLEEPNVAKERLVPLYSVSMEDIGSKLKDENEQLKFEIISMGSKKNDLEEKLNAASTRNEALITQLQDSEKCISNLNIELATLRESKGHMDGQTANQTLTDEDLGKQLIVAKTELNDTPERFSSLKVELEEKSNYCEKLEAQFLELQLKLESVSSKESSKFSVDEEEKQEKQLQTDNEIAKASERLAACQETILNLGKQFKSLASPRDAPLFDKVIASPAAQGKRRPQLLDQMRAEDDANSEEPKSPKTKEMICYELQNAGLFYGEKIDIEESPSDSIKSIIKQSSVKSPGRPFVLDDSNKDKVDTDGGMLVLVPKRQKVGANLLRKLLLRRNKDIKKKITLPSGS